MAWLTLVASLAVAAGFEDRFDDGARDARWGTYGSDQLLTERNGRLELASSPNVDRAYAGWYTTELFDLREGHAQVEIVDPGRQAVGWQMSLSVDGLTADGGSHGQYLLIENGGLQLWEAERGTVTAVDDLARVRWLRIRADRGDAVFEFGPDGGSWTTLYREPAVMRFDAVSVTLQGGTWLLQSPPRLAAFDNFEVVEAPPRALGVGCGCGAAPPGLGVLLVALLGCRRRRVL